MRTNLVSPAPRIVSSSQNLNLTTGQTATFTCQVSDLGSHVVSRVHCLLSVTRLTRFGHKVGQIGPKWDKSKTFSDKKIVLKSAVLKDPLKSLIHRKWLSVPSLTTKTIDFHYSFCTWLVEIL